MGKVISFPYEKRVILVQILREPPVVMFSGKHIYISKGNENAGVKGVVVSWCVRSDYGFNAMCWLSEVPLRGFLKYSEDVVCVYLTELRRRRWR